MEVQIRSNGDITTCTTGKVHCHGGDFFKIDILILILNSLSDQTEILCGTSDVAVTKTQ